MLLNLGLTADAAAAHSNDPSAHSESPPAPISPSNYSAAFSFPALSFLDHFYNRTKQTDGPAQPAGTISGLAMNTVASNPGHGESANATHPSPPLATPPAIRSYTTRKSARSKTSYQFAHPAAHAGHKRLRLRPKLLLQLQQVSQIPRPLPILDILPSTLYLPRLARKFPALFRSRNGLGPNDLIVVMSELYERTVATIPGKHQGSEDEDDGQREVVATICQMLQEDARSKGKAEICLNFGPVWEATPLPSGSYEFVARTENGVQVMRWALRGRKSRRTSAHPGSPVRDDTKRFTFSVIDPTTRRHPVVASMSRNQLEVYNEYPAVARASNSPTTPSSGMSVVSDISDVEEPTEANKVTLDDELRTLIIVTAIWVAFREGWSHNFSYGDPISSPTAKSLVSPTASKRSSPVKGGADAMIDRDDLTPMKDVATGGKRRMSISSVRRSNTMSPSEGGNSLGSLSRRSNSTGAAFMDRAKQRSASGLSNRLNRHSMFNGGEQSRDLVVSRPPSSRQNSVGPDDIPQPADHSKRKSKSQQPENGKVASRTDRAPNPSMNGRLDQPTESRSMQPAALGSSNAHVEKSKRRHRFSSLFAIFHRKHQTH